MTDHGDRPTTNITHGDPAIQVQAGTVHGDVRIVSEPHPAIAVPRQLPFPTKGFVDRTAHLRDLDALAEETATGVPVADFPVVTGEEPADEARARCRSAIEVFGAIGAAWSTAWARCTLGRILTGSGLPEEAVEEYRCAIGVFEELGAQDSRAAALIGLGEALTVLGDVEGAREALATALEYLRDHGDPRAGGIEARLGRLGG